MLGNSIKRQAEDFGGFQIAQLSPGRIAELLCCTRFCGEQAQAQIHFRGGYRVVCGRHAVVILMMTLGVLGDPSPVSEVREFAAALGVDWDRLMETEPKHPVMPEHFVCGRCGGGYLVETIGMFAGKRYIHTCGV